MRRGDPLKIGRYKANYKAQMNVFGHLTVAAILLTASAQASPLVLSREGLGALHVGMTLSQAERAIGHGIPLEGVTADNSKDCAESSISGMPNVRLLLEGLRISVIWVDGDIHTADGVHVGTTEAELRQVFGKRAVFGPRPYYRDDQTSHNVVVRLRGKREFLFQTENGKVTDISVGDRPAVEYMEGCA